MSAVGDGSAGDVGRELREHRDHPLTVIVFTAQGEDGHGQWLALPRERIRMVGGERAVPLESAAGVAGLGEGAGVLRHVCRVVGTLVVGAVEDEGRDVVVFPAEEQSLGQIAFHVEGEVPLLG